MIELKQVNYKYQSTKSEVIIDANITIQEGKVTCIIGKNGSR